MGSAPTKEGEASSQNGNGQKETDQGQNKTTEEHHVKHEDDSDKQTESDESPKGAPRANHPGSGSVLQRTVNHEKFLGPNAATCKYVKKRVIGKGAFGEAFICERASAVPRPRKMLLHHPIRRARCH